MPEQQTKPLSDERLNAIRLEFDLLDLAWSGNGSKAAKDLLAEIERLRAVESAKDAEIARLRAGLSDYGMHHLACPSYVHDADHYACTCGLREAIVGDGGE